MKDAKATAGEGWKEAKESAKKKEGAEGIYIENCIRASLEIQRQEDNQRAKGRKGRREKDPMGDPENSQPVGDA